MHFRLEILLKKVIKYAPNTFLTMMRVNFIHHFALSEPYVVDLQQTILFEHFKSLFLTMKQRKLIITNFSAGH